MVFPQIFWDGNADYEEELKRLIRDAKLHIKYMENHPFLLGYETGLSHALETFQKIDEIRIKIEQILEDKN